MTSGTWSSVALRLCFTAFRVATFDLDILIEASVENAKRLLDALREARFATALLIDAEELLRHEITVFVTGIGLTFKLPLPAFFPGCLGAPR